MISGGTLEQAHQAQVSICTPGIQLALLVLQVGVEILSHVRAQRVEQLELRQVPLTRWSADIFHKETIGPFVLLHNWTNVLRDPLWIHFIDNNATLASLVKEGSSVHSAEYTVGYTLVSTESPASPTQSTD